MWVLLYNKFLVTLFQCTALSADIGFIHLHLVLPSGIQQFFACTALNNHNFTPHLPLLFMNQPHSSFWFVIIFIQYQTNKHNSPCCMYRTLCGMLLCLCDKWYNIYIYGNMRECSKKQTFSIYIVHFLNKNNIHKFILHPVHSIQSYVIRCTLTCEDLWSPKMCLFPLQTGTAHELTAVADTHTEHSQLSHVHTCSSKVLYYTVVPIYTRRLILHTNTVLHLYTYKIISDIVAKADISYFITQD